jgi:hypothetical protein
MHKSAFQTSIASSSQQFKNKNEKNYLKINIAKIVQF